MLKSSCKASQGGGSSVEQSPEHLSPRSCLACVPSSCAGGGRGVPTVSCLGLHSLTRDEN